MPAMYSLSTEYFEVPVEFKVNGAVINPTTTDPVQMAFMPRNVDPGSSDWVNGSWEVDTSQPTPVYWARALVGPGAGGKNLAKGVYAVWLKVTDNPEIPVKIVALLEVL